MNVVRISLEFSGVVLPITHDESGREMVPLKPISDLFGLNWRAQYDKVTQGRMLRRLGTCLRDIQHAGQVREMCCIRLDRVVAYLNSINPDKVRAQGNEDGADFLERKQEEWDDVLNEYEAQKGGIIYREQQHNKLESQRMRNLALLVNRYNDCADQQIRQGLFQLISRCFEGLSLNALQTDMFDSTEKATNEA